MRAFTMFLAIGATLLAAPTATSASAGGGVAPGAPGAAEDFLPADKSEQVWDHQPPATFPAGTPTFSATPLTWTHAQFVRLAQNLSAGRILEQPAVVAERY